MILLKYIVFVFNWLPSWFYAIFTGVMLVKFGDTIVGIISRAWRLIGR